MDVLKPAAVAVKAWVPATGPSVSDTDASPLASVTALTGVTLPPDGAANTTATPATPIPSAARTWTTTGAWSGRPTTPVCSAPLATTTWAGGSTTAAVASSLTPVGVTTLIVTAPR